MNVTYATDFAAIAGVLVLMLFVVLGIAAMGQFIARKHGVVGVVTLLFLLGVGMFGLFALIYLARSGTSVAYVNEVSPISYQVPTPPLPVGRPNTTLAGQAEVIGEIPLEIAPVVPQPADEPKPVWAQAPLGRVGSDYITKATVGPHATRALCDRDMAVELRRVTDEYIDTLIGAPGAGAQVALPTARIQREIVREEYQEPVQASFGPMIVLHAKLVFDKRMQDAIEAEYRQALMHERLRQTAAGAGLLLALVGTLFGYLKLDTLTKGYYSGRLKLAAGAVILTAVAAVIRGANVSSLF